MESINKFLEDGIFNHSDKGRFTGAYYYNIEDIKLFMENNGFETVDLIGSSNIGTLLNNEHKQYWIEQGEKDELVNLLIRISRDPSVLGVSSPVIRQPLEDRLSFSIEVTGRIMQPIGYWTIIPMGIFRIF
ncbi:hypothetical protein [Brevibacillus nitrificans]|uniref:hypothetical protein n=1 Tax=Brevibacillus nitrificans TaxID=651560 RepID=UPI0033AD51AA